MQSPWWQRFWRADAGIFLALWLLLLVGNRQLLFLDPGVFWHPRVGEILLTEGLIHTDPFSFTFAGTPWLPHQWLAEIAEALLYRLAGWDGLFLGAITVLAATYAWVGRRFLDRGFHWLAAATAVALTYGASNYHFSLRPHLLTIGFLGWTFARLCDVEAGRRSVVSLWWLVPAFVLWTNVHGGVLGGLATVGLTAAGWTLAHALGRPTPLTGYRQAAGLGLLLLALAATMAATPYGTGVARVWFTIMGAGLSNLMMEHMPLWQLYRDPNYRELTLRAGLGVLAITLVYVLSLLARREPVRVTWLVPLVWLVLAVSGIRHGPLYAIVAAVALADLLPHTHWVVRPGAELVAPLPAGPRPWAWPLPAAVVLTAVAAATTLHQRGGDDERYGGLFAEIPAHVWPVGLLDDLRSYEGQPNVRIFNEDPYGGILIRFTRLRHFIDDRCELFARPERPFLQEYVAALQEHPDKIEEWRAAYGLNLALTRPDSAFDKYLKGPKGQAAGWRLVKGIVNTAYLYEWRPPPP